MGERLQYQPELKRRYDIVFSGLGPAGLYGIQALQDRVGSNYKILGLEQHPERVGGSGHPSMMQSRLLQGSRLYVESVVSTNALYERIEYELGYGIRRNLPYVFVARDLKQLAGYANTAERTREWVDLPGTEVIGIDELRYRYRFIDREEVAGALIHPEAGQLDFNCFIQYATCNARETTFALGTRGGDIQVNKGKVTGIEVHQGQTPTKVFTDKVVLSPGPFIIHAEDQISGGKLLPNGRMDDIVEVRKRQRFSTTIDGLPPHTFIFLISPEGHYVRIHTGKDGSGIGDYGFADPTDPIVTKPVVDPRADEREFPAIVYAGLGSVVSAYGNEERSGRLARNTTNRQAGYYVDTPDGLPFVAETEIEGLYIHAGWGHGGVMAGMGGGIKLAKIITGEIEPEQSSFRLDREFDESDLSL